MKTIEQLHKMLRENQLMEVYKEVRRYGMVQADYSDEEQLRRYMTICHKSQHWKISMERGEVTRIENNV